MPQLKVPFAQISIHGPFGREVDRDFEEVQRFLRGFSSIPEAEQSSTSPGSAMEIGCWRLGCSAVHAAAGWAELSHRSRWTGTPGTGSSITYGILHNADGTVLINGASDAASVRLIQAGSPAHETRLLANGRLSISHGDAGGMKVGSWPTSTGYAFIGGRVKSDANSLHYLVLGGHASDTSTYFGTGASGSFVWRQDNNGTTIMTLSNAGSLTAIGNPSVFAAASIGTWSGGHANMGYNGTVSHGGGNPMGYMMRNDGLCWIGATTQLTFRLDGNDRMIFANATTAVSFTNNGGGLIATFGTANNTCAANQNICMGLPSGTGNTVTWTSGSTQVLQTTSSIRVKEFVRGLRQASPASGANSPVFRIRPARFRWREWDEDTRTGVVNGKEVNDRHPDGIAGLIADQLAEDCPDAVIWHEGNEHDPDVRPNGVDLNVLMSYVIDAVQHLKEELDDLKRPLN